MCPHPTAKPRNGNLLGYDEYHGGAGYAQFLHLAQSFTYDGVNRLTSASDSNWSRTFNYDENGNMWLTGKTGVGLAENTPPSNVSNGKNQIAQNTSYDQAGNQLTVNGNTITYNAENQQVTVAEPTSVGCTETVSPL